MTGPRDAAGDAHLANVLGAVALRVMTKVSIAIEEASGLSDLQATALSALGVHALDVPGGVSIEQLRHWVCLSHSATVRMVDRLEAGGYVARGHSATDARVTTVSLTATGQDTVDAVWAARAEALAAVVAELDDGQRASLGPLVEALARGDVTATADAAERRSLVYFLCRQCDPGRCGHPSACPVTTASREREALRPA